MKKRLLLLFLVFALALSLTSAVCAASLSPAFDIMIGSVKMTKNVVYQDKISFEISDFADTLGTENFKSITVLSLPSPEVGVLKLGGVDVVKNQTISKSSLPYLYFTAANENINCASFSFSTDAYDSDRPVLCTLNIVENLTADLDKPVSRMDFLIYAMNQNGLGENLPYVLDTGFYDDAQMSGYEKSYVYFAKEHGIISGKTVDENLCFLPDEIITVAEAAVIINNIKNFDVPALVYIPESSPLFPIESRDALLALYFANILTIDDVVCCKEPLSARIANRMLENG